MLKWIEEYFENNKESILKDYFTFLKFKSISADPQHKDHMLAAADWLKRYLEEIGFECQLWQTDTYPTVYGSYHKDDKAKTVLFYNHYDVQPVDPLNEWHNPPFEPIIKDGNVFARGAQDNKGQCFYVLTALKALKEKLGHLPFNIKVCIEGDEEVGSVGLINITPLKAKELNADYLVVVDVAIKGLSEPAISLGTRGLLTMDLKLTTNHTDLHSGSHGGIVLNPISELAYLIAKLHDEESGRVMVPGFYDDIQELKKEELELIDFSFNKNEYEKNFSNLPIGGEKSYTPHERAWIRPTLELNGIVGGYHEEGFKTVLPKSASAKISCRLVKGQDPQKIAVLIGEFLQTQVKKGVKLHFEVLSKCSATLTSPKNEFIEVLSNSYNKVFGKPCSFIMNGGSIGVVGPLSKASNAEVIFMGVGLSTDNIHAPNEHFSIDRLKKGFYIITQTLLDFK
jgi:acetylornithine deacetylase/succinyl-diaminopimelate desuccinylase-like protein